MYTMRSINKSTSILQIYAVDVNVLTFLLVTITMVFLKRWCPVWAREHCRISPPRFLAECRKRRLNQASFVSLCFVLFAFLGCV